MAQTLREPMTTRPASTVLRSWIALAVFFVIAAGATMATRYVDVLLMRGRFALMHDKTSGVLQQFLGGLRNFGEFVTPLIAIAIIATYDRRRRVIIWALVLSQAAAWIGYQAPKALIGRYRPLAAIDHLAPLDRLSERSTWTSSQETLNMREEIRSFPSGHTAAAFALATVLAAFYMRLRWLVWLLAIGCGVSRVLTADHWPCDVVAGAAIGTVMAWLVLAAIGHRRTEDLQPRPT
jgi:membrane-associated phospholipid phosphatase